MTTTLPSTSFSLNFLLLIIARLLGICLLWRATSILTEWRCGSLRHGRWIIGTDWSRLRHLRGLLSPSNCLVATYLRRGVLRLPLLVGSPQRPIRFTRHWVLFRYKVGLGMGRYWRLPTAITTREGGIRWGTWSPVMGGGGVWLSSRSRIALLTLHCGD
ncbi:Uncharacterised protein [Chlamydia trachomatis]|nr:Uncharacterised protein [Chlamydia trachomatis]